MVDYKMYTTLDLDDVEKYEKDGCTWIIGKVRGSKRKENVLECRGIRKPSMAPKWFQYHSPKKTSKLESRLILYFSTSLL